MRYKNKLIIALLGIAAAIFCVIQAWLLPALDARQEEYALRQRDALTHDISAIEKYKTAYLGDASKIGGLFSNLPLYDVGRKYEIDSEKLTLTVNFLDTVGSIGESRVKPALIYNSVAAMAAVDNLMALRYSFPGADYLFTREAIEAEFGSPLSELLTPEVWRVRVQEPLGSAELISRFYAE